MTPEFHLRHTLPAAFALLPPRMDSPEARILLLAIGLQESGFRARVQHGGGPAHGYWQFERGGGVAGVLTHPATRSHAETLCAFLDYAPETFEVYTALPNNDLLACAFARLLLWTLPGPLGRTVGTSWQDYRAAWRPGIPRPDTWPANFARAVALVETAP